MTDLYSVERALAALINKYTPSQRRKLSGQLGRRLRQHQQKRIQQQQNPDGSAFIARKNRTRRVMFRRLRTVRFMRTRTNANSATIYFKGNSDHIARVHHYGLRDKVSKKGRRLEVKYARRQLLGITRTDIDMISQEIINFLSGQ